MYWYKFLVIIQCNICYLDLLFNATVSWTLGTVSLWTRGTVLWLGHLTVVTDVISGLLEWRGHGSTSGVLRRRMIWRQSDAGAGQLLLRQPVNDTRFSLQTLLTSSSVRSITQSFIRPINQFQMYFHSLFLCSMVMQRLKHWTNVKVKVKVKVWTLAIAPLTWVRLVTSTTSTISEVAADWHEPMVP